MTVHLKDIITHLYDCGVGTTEEDIRAKVRESFLKIGKSQAILFLEATHAYLVQNTKLNSTNRAYILLLIADVLDLPGVVAQLDQQECLLTINLAIQEMLRAKEDENDWSESARKILLVVSKQNELINHVMDGLLQKFIPGSPTPPNKVIIQTLAAISQCNPTGFVPFLTDILSRTVPLLPHIKGETMKDVWAKAISSFCESLMEVATNESKHEDGEYSNNILPHITVELRNNYCDQMELVLDSILAWLNAKEMKTRSDVFEAIGALFLLVSQERILKELKKVISAFLSLYKKGNVDDQYSMTKGIFMLLLRTCADEVVPIEPYLDDIWTSLFQHVTVNTEQMDEMTKSSTNPIQMRLRNEVCRSFLASSQRFGDKLVYYLLHKMQSVQDSTKLGAIDLIRHLLNSSEANMEDKRSLIVMGLKPLLCDDSLSIKAKMSMCQLCVALADHGYVHIDSGGSNVIQFLTTNLIFDTELTNKKIIPPSPIEIIQLRNQSAKALCTIANTCESAQHLLWPNLLEFICAENYSPVVMEICKVLRILVKKMKENGTDVNFKFGNDVNPRVAGQHQVLTRLIASMNIAPLSANLIPRAKEAILLLQALGSSLHPALETVIENQIGELMAELDGTMSPVEMSPKRNSIRFSPEPPLPIKDFKKAKVERFQEKVLNLLKEIISMNGTAEWLEPLASAQGKQLAIYNKYPNDKAFLMQCLGFTLSKIATESFVKEHLILIFRGTNHLNSIERRGCASAVGHCSKQHTNLMLTELENIAKWEHSKKTSGFIGFLKDAMPYSRTIDQQAIYLRSTIVLSYGYLIQLSPIEYLPQRLEQTVLPFLRQYMVECKNDVVVRESHLETIQMIAETIGKLTNDYKFESRYEMFSYIKEYVNQEIPTETLSTWIRLLACKATTKLVKLQPPISDNELWDMANILSKSILTIYKEKPGLKTLDGDESSTIMDATVNEYRNAISEMIKMKPIVGTICQMWKILKPFYGSQSDYERLRSIDTTVLILKLYLKKATDFQIGHANDFPPLPGLLARLSPRILDSFPSVRILALQAVWLSFQLSLLHRGQISRTGEDSGLGYDPDLFDLEEFKETHLEFDGKSDVIKGRSAITAIAEHIENHLPQSQLQIYLSGLFKMVMDKQSNVSSASAQLLSVILKHRGSLLHEEAEMLVQTILDNLSNVQSHIQTYTDLLNALTYFADHQIYSVVDVLLKQPIPHSNCVSDAWKTMVHQPGKFAIAADHVLELTNCTNLDENTTTKHVSPQLFHYETVDLSGGCIVKLVNQNLCSYMAALTEMIKSGEPDESINERIAKILAVIFHSLTSVIDVQYPSSISQTSTTIDGKKKKEPAIITAELKRISTSPASLVAETLRALLERIKAGNVIETMNTERAWSQLVQPDSYITAIGIVCKALCDYYPSYMRSLMEIAINNASSLCEFQKISSAVILSSLITRCPKLSGEFDETLLDLVVTELKHFVKDKNLLVRKLAIRGYTSIGTLATTMPNGDAVAHKYAKLAFEAAINGLDDAYDRKDEIAAESVYALDSVVTVVDSDFVEQSLSNLLLKLRPCFEKENPCLRAVSFSLFGKLGTIVGETNVFKQNIHENIVSILLHLNDEDEQVRNNCALVLIQTSPLLSLDTLGTVIGEHLIDNKPPTNYSNFLKDVGMILVLSFPDRLNFYALGCSNYYKSQFAQIRANAALFTGFLLEPLSPALRGTLSKELVFTSLIQLLRDPSSHVKMATIKAISCLHSFS